MIFFFFSDFLWDWSFFFFFFWNGVMCFWVKDHCLFTAAYQVYIASKWLNTPSVVLNLFIGVVFVRFSHLTFLFFSLSAPLFTKSLSTTHTYWWGVMLHLLGGRISTQIVEILLHREFFFSQPIIHFRRMYLYQYILMGIYFIVLFLIQLYFI